MSFEEGAKSVSSTSTRSALSGTTEALFQLWLRAAQQPSSVLKKTDFQREAFRFFCSLAQNTQFDANGTVLQTRSSHEEALALLIRELGPAFTSDMSSRVSALHYVAGSIEGCKGVDLPLNLLDLLGNFLLQHCGPIQDDESDVDEECDEQVRDAAVVGISKLLLAAPSPEDSYIQGIQERLELAKSAVERRCAVPEYDPGAYSGGFGRRNTGFQSGLSTLPRSRRSLCFDCLGAAIEAVGLIVSHALPHDQVLREELNSFSSFVFSCLHGESDPRCLLQLLRLFKSCLETFLPAYKSSLDSSFPISDLFDAVAPYYPVQFTPPPNDVHGITRAILEEALFSILCFTDYDPLVAGKEEDTMLNLTLGIVLERLVPPPEEEPSTLSEKLAACSDLSRLLRLDSSFSLCERVDHTAMKHIASNLVQVHDEAALKATKGGEEGECAKELGALVRTLSERIALSSESCSGNQWEAFVSETMISLGTKLSQSPSKHRSSVAYLSSLCSCGGQRTLQKGLETGLNSLLSHISTELMEDSDIATSLFGIGAFFSSCRAGVEKASRDGLHFDPHPLHNYISKSLEVLQRFSPVFDGTEDGNGSSVGIRVAAVRAMESILLSTPASLYSNDQVEIVSSFVERISRSLIGSSSPASADVEDNDEWMRACAVTIGTWVGSIHGDSNGTDKRIRLLDTEGFRSLLLETILPSLIATTTIKQEGPSPRNASLALSVACTQGLDCAKIIVTAMVENVSMCLGKGNISDARTGLETLSVMFQEPRTYAPVAFRSLASTSCNQFTLLDSISSIEANEDSKALESSFGTSQLRLPASLEERMEISIKIKSSQEFVQFIKTAYHGPVEIPVIHAFLCRIEKVLPPISGSDVVQLSLELPILAVLLRSSEKNLESFLQSSALQFDVANLCHELAEFGFSKDFDEFGQVNALASVECLLSVPGCTDLEKFIKSTILPRLTRFNVQSVEVEKSRNIFYLLASAGVAAAHRGALHLPVSDDIVQCLVSLASNTASTTLLGMDLPVPLESIDGEVDCIAWTAAAALGSLVLSKKVRGVTRQRLHHVAVKNILKHAAELSDDWSAFKNRTLVYAACVVVSAIQLNHLEASDLHQLSKLIIQALAPRFFDCDDAERVRGFLLAATLKLVSNDAFKLSHNLPFIATAALRAYSAKGSLGDAANITTKLIALQVLQSVAHSQSERRSILTLKDAVIAILSGAMNHPSAVLRHAALEVKNAWDVLED